MKKLTKKSELKTLQFNQETIKVLTDTNLSDVRGGQMHNSFSCGRDLCTTHQP